MRYTLLEVVQAVLNDMDSDAVNSISDTEESSQVVSIAKDLFYSMVDELQLPCNKKVIQPDAAGVGYPNYLKLPDSVKSVDWVRYNCRIDNASDSVYNELVYLTPDEFIYTVTKRNSTDTSITVVNDPVSGVPIFVYNDRHPTYWTSFDDKYICCDAHKSSLDTELQSSQAMVSVEQAPAWSNTDGFQIPFPDHLQSLYLNELKSMCFITLKQTANDKIEQQAQRLRFTVTEQKNRTDKRPRRPNYGRN